MDISDLKALVIDDHMIMRRLVEKNAETLGFGSIENAENGLIAMRRINANNYNIVLADWNMPEMSGLELLEEVRKNPELDHMAFVMITAESEKSKIMQAMNAGATAYLAKPFSPNDFKDMVEKILSWLENK